jgi:hypothetical protein
MPSRKQRRRRQKDRRHEWEYVYVDDAGHEVEAPDEESPLSRNGKRAAQQPRKTKAGGMRDVQPPSWRRVGKRGLIFAPLMFLTVTFLSGNLTVAQRLVNTVFLLAFFLPFSYAIDALMYRMYKKRSGAA